MNEELTVRERLNRYEVAQETIGFMIALRTSELYKVENQAAPDNAEIEMLNGEISRLQDELYDLSSSDNVAIQHVLDDYGPILKAAHKKMCATA